MVTYMSIIAQKATELTKTKFSDVFEALEGFLIDDGITNEMAEYLEHDAEIEKLIKEEQKYAEKLKDGIREILSTVNMYWF